MNRLYLVASALIAIAMVGFAQPSGARALQHHAHRHHGIQLVRAAAHDRVPVRSERPVPARDGSRDRPHRRATMPRLTHRGTSHRGFAKYGSRHATNAPSHDSRQHDAGTRIGVQSAIPVRSPQTQVISGRGPPPHHPRISNRHPAPTSFISPLRSSQLQPPKAAGPTRDRSDSATQGAPAQVEAAAHVRSLDPTETGQPNHVRPLTDRLKGAAGSTITPFAGGTS